jgi:hypothetical protein
MAKPRAGAGAKRRRRAKPNWKNIFLAELAQTSNVAASALKAGKDKSGVYKERRTDSTFARQWFDALCEGYDNLEMDLLQRLRAGELHGGTPSDKAKRKFDNPTAFRLLAAHRAAVTRTRARRAEDDESAVYEAIHAKLDAMRRRAEGLPALIEQGSAKPVPAPDGE